MTQSPDGDETGQNFLLTWFPWLILSRSFTLSTAAHVMLLAVVGSVATCAGWRLAGKVLSESYLADHDILRHDVEHFSTWPGARIAPRFPLDGSPILPKLWSDDRLGNPPEDPLRAIPTRMTVPLVRFMRLETRGWGLLYYFLGWIWTIVVWSFFGAAISRMAAMKFTRDERVELRDAVAFARGKQGSCLMAYFLPILGIAALAVPIAVLGLLMRVNFGVILGGVFWLFVVTFSFMMVLLAIGLIFGWPLMWGAIATENTDAFDAVSRAFAYTFQRPMRFLGYILFVTFVGTLGWMVLWGVSEGMIGIGAWAASVGAGRERMQQIELIAQDATPSGLDLWVGSKLIGFWNHLIRTLATSFAYAFFFTSMTGIYIVLRRDVDATELDEVHVPDYSDEDDLDHASGPVSEDRPQRTSSRAGSPNGSESDVPQGVDGPAEN